MRLLPHLLGALQYIHEAEFEPATAAGAYHQAQRSEMPHPGEGRTATCRIRFPTRYKNHDLLVLNAEDDDARWDIVSEFLRESPEISGGGSKLSNGTDAVVDPDTVKFREPAKAQPHTTEFQRNTCCPRPMRLQPSMPSIMVSAAMEARIRAPCTVDGCTRALQGRTPVDECAGILRGCAPGRECAGTLRGRASARRILIIVRVGRQQRARVRCEASAANRAAAGTAEMVLLQVALPKERSLATPKARPARVAE